MRRRQNRALKHVAWTLGLTCLLAVVLSRLPPDVLKKSRMPAATSISEFTPDQIAKAEWAVAPGDFENSDPRGRSYFDYVFSRIEGGKRVYDVPYPFQNVLRRVNGYLGYKDGDGEAVSTVLFPMGRSLQRNAALLDSDHYDLDLFFRFPRIVMAVDKEPKVPFAHNLKGRLYLGFHEKSKVIEAISYNDEEGRYEYQVVRDYEAGRKPTVVYANRQLCLSCHQNQTPIFSKGPWNESNAHANVADRIEAQLTKALKNEECSPTSGALCTKQGRMFYFGAPTRVDLNVPYAMDVLTDQGNEYHALQKIWLSLCGNPQCQAWVMKSVFRYLLNGQEGVLDEGDHRAKLAEFDGRFRERFPHGLKIPSPNVPNRDPLQDRGTTQAEIERQLGGRRQEVRRGLQEILAQSTVPGELEPLMPRAPVELWTSSEIDARLTNRLIRGLADFFSQEDLKALDRWLRTSTAKLAGQTFEGKCRVQKTDAAGGFDVQVVCAPNESLTLALQSGYFSVRGGRVGQGSLENLFFYPSSSSCQRRAAQSVANRMQGVACPAVLKSVPTGTLDGDLLRVTLARPGGLSARLLDGRSVRALTLDLQSGVLTAEVVGDHEAIDRALEKLRFVDPVTRKPAQLPFSRKAVLSSLASSLGIPIEDPDVAGKMDTLEKNLEAEADPVMDLSKPVTNPLKAFVNSCGMCHYNFEGVPPAFLGLKQSSIDDLGKCRRIEACAARILYRIKMRNCPESAIARFKKNPMPLPAYFNKTRIDASVWQKNVSPALVGFLRKLVPAPELTKELISKGVEPGTAATAVNELLNADCPNVDYTIYESLPVCDFRALKADSACEGLNLEDR